MNLNAELVILLSAPFFLCLKLFLQKNVNYFEVSEFFITFDLYYAPKVLDILENDFVWLDF